VPFLRERTAERVFARAAADDQDPLAHVLCARLALRADLPRLVAPLSAAKQALHVK
jgi:hypothetical protein